MERLDDSEFQLKRVYDWLMDEDRELAQTKFTAGWQRNLAKEVEFRLSLRAEKTPKEKVI